MLDRKLYKIIEQALGRDYIEQYPEKFEYRIIVQKAMYLLTNANRVKNIKLPYKWNFYLYGPYSSEMAHMIYHINEVSEEVEKKQIDIRSKERRCIEHFSNLKSEVRKIHKKKDVGEKLSLSEIYEIMGTITYFVGQVGNNREKVRDIFGNYKPKLQSKVPNSIFNQLYSILEQYKYI